MSAGMAIILALAGGVLLVVGVRGTYSDVWEVLIHPAGGQEKAPGNATESGGAGSGPAPTHKE